jgi:hypothetical protein
VTVRRTAVVLFLGLVVVTALAGCSVVSAVRRAAHDLESNKNTIDAFSGKIASGQATPFQATYVTTGSSPATVVYAVEPPSGLAFTDTPSGAAGPSIDVVVNSTGEYACHPPSGAGAPWTCEKLGSAAASSQNQIFNLYTPAHWINFLKGFSLAAGLAGDKVTSSTMTVNGFSLSCVDLWAPGIPGTSSICTTAQGILGYVQVASDSTSFEIKSYSASPSPGLFQLPAGATVTSPPTTNASPASPAS